MKVQSNTLLETSHLFVGYLDSIFLVSLLYPKILFYTFFKAIDDSMVTIMELLGLSKMGQGSKMQAFDFSKSDMVSSVSYVSNKCH